MSDVAAAILVVGDSVYAIDPSGAHRTRLGLTFPLHQVINQQRPAPRGERFAQSDGSRWCIDCIQVDRTLDKLVLVQRWTGRVPARFHGDLRALLELRKKLTVKLPIVRDSQGRAGLTFFIYCDMLRV